MENSTRDFYRSQLEDIKSQGLLKSERLIESPQGSNIKASGRSLLNFCANNYLGFANHPKLVEAAKRGLDQFGLGLSSVRFICGTQTIHKQLEAAISQFLSTEETILYASCFDANGGLFETLLSEEDAVVSDSLNHASIIDGIRLCKAARYRYQHADMQDLEKCLEEAKAKGAKKILISSDGAFSMDGDIAKLPQICELAQRFGALVHIDDCHCTGVIGKSGRGTQEHCGLNQQVDLITSTLGKALGGSVGGFTSGRRELIDILRQRSRPYLFSNTLPPAVVCASLEALKLIDQEPKLLLQLKENTKHFRTAMSTAGFKITPGEHPIVPIMLGDAKLASDFADRLMSEGIYVIGFSFPVVPKGAARIRVQLSAAHSKEQVDLAVAAFTKIGRALGVID